MLQLWTLSLEPELEQPLSQSAQLPFYSKCYMVIGISYNTLHSVILIIGSSEQTKILTDLGEAYGPYSLSFEWPVLMQEEPNLSVSSVYHVL